MQIQQSSSVRKFNIVKLKVLRFSIAVSCC